MIKLIATDMDGTFLRADKSYDRELFAKALALMEARGVKFVVASGNQFKNLKSRFPGVSDRLYYIAENGGLIAHGHEIVQENTLSKKQVAEASQLSTEHPDILTIWAGAKAAYVRKRDGQAFYDEMSRFFNDLKMVDDFPLDQDRFFKMTFVIHEGGVSQIAEQMKEEFPDLGFVCGSAVSIDVSRQDLNKAAGLKYFRDRFGIQPSEMVAFGDSGNDIAMLKYAGTSFVTGTAMPEAKQAADYVLASSEESAVQNKIIELLSRN